MCRETREKLPADAVQLAVARQDVADADVRYRRLDDPHASALAQLAAVRAEAAAASAAAAGEQGTSNATASHWSGLQRQRPCLSSQAAD